MVGGRERGALREVRGRGGKEWRDGEKGKSSAAGRLRETWAARRSAAPALAGEPRELLVGLLCLQEDAVGLGGLALVLQARRHDAG
jgi:hypothetical protein